MLIKTSKSPGWGKLKPRQWGPLSAVSSNLCRNAESLYGIDPNIIAAAVGCWGNNFPIELLTGNRHTLVGTPTLARTSTGVLLASAATKTNYLQYKGRFTVGTADKPFSIFTVADIPTDSSTIKLATGLSFGDTFESTLPLRKSTADGNDTFNHISIGATETGRLTLGESLIGGFDRGKSVAMGGFVNGTQAGIHAAYTDTGHYANVSGTVGASSSSRINVNFGRNWEQQGQSNVLFSILFVSQLPDDVFRLLIDSPYGLLTRVAPPSIFDFGAIGPTIITINRAVLSFAGQALKANEDITIGADALTWSGQDIKVNQTIVPATRAIDWVGQAVKANKTLTVDKTNITWTGQDIKVNVVCTIGSKFINWSGKTLTIFGEVLKKFKRRMRLSLGLGLRL